jgi:hypothetical protein
MAKNSRTIAITVWSSVAATTVAGVVAYKTVFSRPGADALELLPKSATAVFVMDLNPAPSQAGVYKRINDALDRNQLGKRFDSMLFDAANTGNPKVELFRPYLQRGAVCAALPGDPNPRFLLLLPISDAGAVRKLLQENGQAQSANGMSYYTMNSPTGGPQSPTNLCFAVIADRLVISDIPGALSEVMKTSRGEVARLIDQPDFQAARRAIPADANLFTLVSPAFTKALAKRDTLSSWGTFAITLRDQGIEMVGNGTTAADLLPAQFKDRERPALRADLLKSLPENPYALVAAAGLGNDLKSGLEEAKKTDEYQRDVSRMEKELDLSLDRDVLPNLQGTSVAALYPTAAGSSLDLVLLMDSDNGAKPAAMVQKLVDEFTSGEKFRDPEASSATPPVPISERETIGEWTITKPTAKAQAETEKSLAESEKSLGMPKMFQNKTLVMATKGGAVLVATSRELLDKAMSSYDARNTSEASSAALAGLSARRDNRDQFLMAISLAAISETIRHGFDASKMDKDGQKTYNEVMDAVAKFRDPVLYSGFMTKQGEMNLKMMIPMDWDLLIDKIAEATKQSNVTPPRSVSL